MKFCDFSTASIWILTKVSSQLQHNVTAFHKHKFLFSVLRKRFVAEICVCHMLNLFSVFFYKSVCDSSAVENLSSNLWAES